MFKSSGGGGFMDFGAGMTEQDQADKESRKKEREKQIKERVNKLIQIWDKNKASEEFQNEQDPMVILELQKTLHGEMTSDFKKNIEDMNRYLAKRTPLL